MITAKVRHEVHVARDGAWTADCTTIDITRAGVKVGEATVLVCSVCLYAVATCNHVANTWVDNATRLICDLCGTEGT